jgi:hypothetical protein
VKRVIFFLSIILFGADAACQIDTSLKKTDSIPQNSYLIQKVTRNGITMPEIQIKEVTIVARPSPAKRNEYRKYERLILNIKKVYPYALMVRRRLEKVNEDMKNITSEKERKEYIKNVEKDVFAEYEGDMRQMTITQGRLLIKLIDRETQNTSYELIKVYRGKISAAFWQSIARIFGTNLKEHYDAYGDDALIELIIRDIDAGRL